LGYYAASRVNSSPAFRYNLSAPSSKVKNPKIHLFGLLKVGPMGCPETSARNYHYSLCDNQEERSSYLLGDGSVKSRRALRVTSVSELCGQLRSDISAVPVGLHPTLRQLTFWHRNLAFKFLHTLCVKFE
jgi:hypothetical protein